MQAIDNRYQPPQASRHVVARRRLLLQLLHGQGHRLTTIVAPAGYGKTSLAGQWHASLVASGLRAAWISLDADAHDPVHFLSGVLGTLGSSDQATDIASLSVSSLLAMLITNLREQKQPLVIFLDDYHLARSEPVDALLDQILHDSSTPHLRLVLITRALPHFPLSALRLRGEFKQVDVADLRFSLIEAQEFFADSEVALSAEMIEQLTGRTEGWAVAMQMVRMLLGESGHGDGLLESFGGTNADMGRYLSEQVLSSLPPDIRHFLLRTAALPEVSANLAVAVTGSEATRNVFFRLDAYPLPQAHLDPERHWVRYHPVFREYLIEEAARQQLPINGILAQAAAWFEARGEIEAAVRHALLSGNAGLAATIIETAGGWRLVYASSRGGMALFRALLAQVSHLELHDFPLTTLGLAVVSAKVGQQEAANHYMLQVETRRGRDDLHLGRQLRVVRALLRLYSDHRMTDRELTELENDLTVDQHLETVHRGLLLNLLSFNFLNRAELDRAMVYGELSIRCLRDAGAHFGAMHLHCHIGQAAFFAGNAVSAEESYNQMIGEAQQSMGSGSDLDAIGQVLLAELEAVRGRFPRALSRLDWALPHVERHDTWFDILAAGVMTRQLVAIVGQDYEAAHTALDHARRTAQRRNLERLRHLTDTEQFRLLIASSELDEAARFARRVRMTPDTAYERDANNLSLRLRGSSPALLWIRLWLDTGQSQQARDTLERLKGMQRDKLHVLRCIEVDLLEIRLLLAEGRRPEAAERLSATVLGVAIADYRAPFLIEGAAFQAELKALAASDGVPAVVGARLAQLDRADDDRGAGARPADKLPYRWVDLTGREQMILRLVSTGVTNKDIGRRLQLTDNTVKFHLKNIFAKLRVNTRTGAVAAARDLGLLV